MPYAPLISKIRCHNPNKSKTPVNNKAYLGYIATREGVDLSKKIEIQEEEKVYLETDNTNYLSYIANRPRSHGLFGNKNQINLKEVEKEIFDLSKKGRNIYRGIISLSEKDAKELGFTNKEMWNTYMRAQMPAIAKILGISSIDFTWVGAFHAEETHPHVHYMLWSNKDIVQSPFIHTSKQIACRELLSKAMFNDEYENTIKEIYKNERDELNKIRNENRNLITNKTKQLMQEIEDVFTSPNIPGAYVDAIPKHIRKEELQFITQIIQKIMSKLPGKGSFDYRYLPVDCKEQVHCLSNYLMNNRLDIKKAIIIYMDAVEKGNKMLGKTKFQIEILRNNAKKDIENRINNIILKEIKKLVLYKNVKNTIIEEGSTSIVKLFNNQHSDVENKFEKERIRKSFIGESLENDNTCESIKNLLKDAEKENVYAQYVLGELYIDEKSNFYNLIDGIKYLTLSAEKGNMYAQCALGNLFLWGKNEIYKDEKKGREWLIKAIIQGNEYAKRSLESYDSAPNCAYNIVKVALNSILIKNQQEIDRSELYARTYSKQVMKERQRKEQVRGNLDFEEE